MSVSAQVLSFPTAVGVGKLATGGRGGTVYHVTNLNDSGTGSFRDAVSVSNRIIVFDVGGYINLSTPISVKSNITIAGQTAPGGGIGIMGREVSFANSSNIIVRYMRFRQGKLDADATKSGINLLDVTNAIFDHVSIEFAQWNNIDAVGASNITFQNTISADPIGQQFAAHTETGPYTWYRCLFANSHNRNPLAKDNTQYINNVVYDYQAGYTAGNSAGIFTHDIVGNYFIAGPKTTNAGDAYYQMTNQSVYINGNYEDSNKDGILNGSVMGYPGGSTALSAPWDPETNTIVTLSAANAYAYVVAHVGASLHRDSVDMNVINNVTSLGTSGDLWTTQTATGLGNSGYGTIIGGPTPLDTDQDGMPDAWEIANGTNPEVPDDKIVNSDGYTNIEHYINCLVGEGTCNPVTCVATITAPVTTICSGNSVTLTASSGSSYKWFNGTTQVGTNQTYTATVGGSYTIQVINASACMATSTATVISVTPLPNTPTVTSPISYCRNATATILSATGTGLKWYTVSTSGTASTTAPTPSTSIAGTTNYYVSQTVNTCEGPRATIAVTVNALPNAPTVTSPLSYCQNATATILSATGTGLKWYTVSTGGTASTTAPIPSTATAGTTNYYVSQTVNTCEGPRATIAVTVNALPNAPTVTSPLSYCQNATATILSATGTGLKWYTVSTGGTASTTAPIPSTATAGTTNYYVSQTVNTCEGPRATIAVTVNALPNATITVGSSTTFCAGGSVLLTASSSSSYKWLNGTNQVGTNQTFTATSAGTYTVTLTNAAACSSVSAPVTVTVTPAITWYADEDGDGKGDPNVTLVSCTQPAGYVAVAGDGCPLDPNKIAPGNCGCGKTEQSCLDCAGIPNGTAVKDSCGNCVGGTTGLTACTITTGTIRTISSANLLIYPQPFESNTTIELKNGSNILSIAVFNTSGSAVYSMQNINSTKIELGQQLAEGLYIVLIQTETDLLTAKIIKK